MPHPLTFAHRTDWPLFPNPIASTLDQLRRQGKTILDLTESNPTRCGFTYPSEIFQAVTIPENQRYEPHPQGMLSAREAVSRYYRQRGLRVPAERIFLTSSTSEAYAFLFRLLLNAGDSALFPQPSYPLFQFLVDLNDARMEYYSLRCQKAWRMDFFSLEEKLSAAKVVIVVNPNNPTGSYVKNAELNALNAICQRQGMAIISDEVFGDFSLAAGDEAPLSLVENEASLTFVLSGISKILALPQMKISWIVVNGPASLVESAVKRLEIIADTYLSVNAPAQNALPIWLGFKEQMQSQIMERARHNYAVLKRVLEEAAPSANCHLLEAEGGWYAILKIPEILSEEAWTLKFLVDDLVFAHPGYFFDFPNGAHFVLSLLPEREIFEEAVKRIFKRVSRECR